MNDEFDEDDDDADYLAYNNRRYESLTDALRHRKIPMENHALIRRVTDAIGIEGLYQRGSYIRATRIGGGRDIQIHAGYTNGFLSEDEIVCAAGDIERWPSARARDTWGITHPVNGGQRGERAWRAGEKPDYGTCRECGMKFSAALTCSCN